MGFFDTHANDGEVPKFRLYYLGLTLPGTVAAAVASGSSTVTPGSMYGIAVGKVLTVVDSFVSAVATAPSPATSGTTMQLTTGDDVKLPPTPFYARVWAANEVVTSLNSEIVQVTGVNTLTHVLTIVRAVTSPRSIVVGDQFAVCLAGGGVLTEDVTVSGTTLSTFTATFAHGHPAGWTFSVPIPVYWTDADINIVWDGHTWVVKPITFGSIVRAPDGASGDFKVSDTDNSLFPVLVACNGGELANAAIYEAGFLTTNKTAVPDEVLTVFTGRVDRAAALTANEDNIQIFLMPPVQEIVAKLPTRPVSTLVRVT